MAQAKWWVASSKIVPLLGSSEMTGVPISQALAMMNENSEFASSEEQVRIRNLKPETRNSKLIFRGDRNSHHGARPRPISYTR